MHAFVRHASCTWLFMHGLIFGLQLNVLNDSSSYLRSLLLQLLHQLRYYFEKVSDKADIRHLEDWCIRILVE